MPIREATPDDAATLARLHVATWRETYRGLLPDSYLDGLTAAGREPQWRRATAPGAAGCVFVAEEEGGKLVGFASGGPHGGALGHAAELYTLYLLRAHQGRGLGRGLFAAVAGRLRERGLGSLALWVLATNAPARGFYAALGGRFMREQEIAFDGLPLREAAYGWADSAMIGCGEDGRDGE